MTHPIDTSPEAIAALLDELRTIGCHSNGDARCTCGIGQDAASLIDRLTAERDEARAQVAAAFEVAASHYENGFPAWDTFAQFAKECRALTPADATAALAARDAAMRNEGRRQAAEIARDDAKSETGVILNRRLAGIGVPVAASARRRQAIRTALRILSTLEPEGGE